MICFLDFETRSRIDLKKVGQSVYTNHPSTEILCMAFAMDNEEVQLWTPGNPIPFDVDDIDEFHAHNASFEMAIWSSICVPRLEWPQIPLSRWRCTAAQCAALALPRSLDKASEALGLSERKDNAGHRIMLKMSKPRKPTKKNPAEWVNDIESKQKLYHYCKQDVVTERAIHHATVPLTRQLQNEWQLDHIINQRGVPVDTETVNCAVHIREKFLAWADGEMSKITGGQATTAKQVAKITAWLIDQGLNVGTLRASDVKGFLAQDDVVGDVRRVLLLRQVASLSSTAKYVALQQRADRDNRIRGAHLFHGAATGRWAGKGVQFQNVPRGNMNPGQIETAIEAMRVRDYDLFKMLYPGINSTLSSCIRSMVQAPKGKRLIVCDFSGIEARVLAWLAGEKGLIETFVKGEDVYKVMAAKIYDVDYQDVTKSQRFLGKVAILGLGYGMGHEKFKATVENFGGEISTEDAKSVVATYRQSYKKIVKFWYMFSDMAMEVIADHKTQQYGKLGMRYSNEYLKIKLPSMRELSYYQPEVNKEDTLVGRRPQISYMGIDSYTNQWKRLRSYGGKICENIIQAVARDLLMSALVKLECAGYEVSYHIHDEVICEVPEEFGSLAEVKVLMCDTPSWAKGCPVDAEGYEAKRFRK